MKFFVILILAILSSFSTIAEPLPAGPSQFTFPNADPITVFTYKPYSFDHGPILVVFHGVDRNAEEYRDLAISMANRFKAIVIAPLFDKERFKKERYQWGGLLKNGKAQPRDSWTYAIVHRLVAHVRALEERPDMPYFLIGHSAGGQFLARMAAFYPGEAQRIVAANPGSHLFPSRDLPFGYGFGELPAELNSDEVLRTYLSAPLTLYLGVSDTIEDKNFDTSREAMKEGSSRIERGRACFEKARSLAIEKNWVFNWRKVEVSGVGHSASRMFAAEEVRDALFESAPIP